MSGCHWAPSPSEQPRPSWQSVVRSPDAAWIRKSGGFPALPGTTFHPTPARSLEGRNAELSARPHDVGASSGELPAQKDPKICCPAKAGAAPGWSWAGRGLVCQKMALALHGAACGAGASQSIPAARAPQLASKPFPNSFPGIPQVWGFSGAPRAALSPPGSWNSQLFPQSECRPCRVDPSLVNVWKSHFFFPSCSVLLPRLKALFPKEKKHLE